MGRKEEVAGVAQGVEAKGRKHFCLEGVQHRANTGTCDPSCSRRGNAFQVVIEFSYVLAPHEPGLPAKDRSVVTALLPQRLPFREQS